MKKKYGSKRIALIGLDGSGKTTQIKEMKQSKYLENYYFVWVRWKPFFLKPAYWFLNFKLKRKKITHINKSYQTKTELKNHIFKNSVVRTVWMILAFVDYWLQFYIKTGWLLILRKNIIFDRYYLDLLVDQGINFGYSSEKIRDEVLKFQAFFPRLDKIIYIRVSPDICLDRKEDIPSMEYLKKRYEIYETLSKNENWISIDGEQPVEMVYFYIKQLIIENN